MSMFNFIRNKLFSNKALLLCMSVSNKWEFLLLSILASQHLSLSIPPPPILAIKIGVLWYFIVVLTYIFLMTNYVEHLFMCFFVNQYLTWWGICSDLLRIFNWVYCFLNLKFYEFLMYSTYKTYSSYMICKYFLSVTYLFILLTVSLAEQEF